MFLTSDYWKKIFLYIDILRFMDISCLKSYETLFIKGLTLFFDTMASFICLPILNDNYFNSMS